MGYFKKKSAERQRVVPKSPKVWGAQCDICPLNGLSKPVWGDGPNSATLAIVGDSPGRYDEEPGIPFMGKGGEYLELVLSKNNLKRDDVLLDNAIACCPPGGDYRTFVQVAKKEWNAKRKDKSQKMPDPVDCCRPRLMFSLGIPRCGTCGNWKLLETHPFRCRCQKPKWAFAKGREPVTAVVAAGNAALTSLTGHDGILAKQLYTFEVK
jgi:hypothetical protein